MKNEANGDRITRAMGTMMDHRATEPTSVDNEDAKVTLDSIGEGPIRFTFFWTSKGSWEGRDYMVEVES